VWVLDGSQAVLAVGKFERAALMTLAVLLWWGSRDMVFLLVAAGLCFRLFTKDDSRAPSRFIAAYYAVVLILLAVILRAVPGHGFGME
jgi:hypothetical protein